MTVHNPSGKAPLLLVCEHASGYIPEHYNNLDLSPDVLASHAALDIGALDLALDLSRLFDAPLVASGISRLVYDCNRPLSAADAIPEKSEIYTIPGNAGLNDDEKQRRYTQFYQPFERAIREQLDQPARQRLFVSIHSFTPVYHGRERSVDIGVLFSQDNPLASALLSSGSSQSRFHVEPNQPYGPGDGVSHTLDLHANSRSLPNAMLEVKNSLLTHGTHRQNVLTLLTDMMTEAALACDCPIPSATLPDS